MVSNLPHVGSIPAHRLVLIIGPIASGKTTLANDLAAGLRSLGEAVAVIGLDTVAEMALPTLDDWTWAHEIHGQLVGAWLGTPIPTVIAEGPETPAEIAQIMRYVDRDTRVLKVLVTTEYETALARAGADPTRGLSKDPRFLRQMYDRFEMAQPEIRYDLRFDTGATPTSEIVRHLITKLAH